MRIGYYRTKLVKIIKNRNLITKFVLYLYNPHKYHAA